MYTDGNSFTITIPGTPMAKARPRFARLKGKVCTFDPQSVEKETLRWVLKSRYVGKDPISGPIRLRIVFILSHKKKKEAYHTKKPDLDNLIKMPLDAGNGILWVDDKQIVSIDAIKIYGEEPRTVLTIEEINPTKSGHDLHDKHNRDTQSCDDRA